MPDIDNFMTPRLLTVARFVRPESHVADVGTDHAYVPVWLVKNGIASSSIAMDINRGPIERASENIKKFGLSDNIKTRLSNGLEALLPGEADTVIIAGMGGILINEILENAKHLNLGIRHFILQPMTAVEETRKYLEKNGFLIEDERLSREDDKIYTVLSVIRGTMKIETEIGYYVGESLIKNRDALLLPYLDGKIYELEKAIFSMKAGEGKAVQEKRERFISLCDQMKEIREGCASW